MSRSREKAHFLIESLEAKTLKNRPTSLKIADSLTSSFGSVAFLVGNFFFFIGWILVNLGKVPPVPIFDPFPFILLTMLVSLEAIVLTVIVLMSQNRQSQINTLREELDMQVNLISEREITKLLRLLKLLLEKRGKTPKDAELEEMIKETDVSYIERRLVHQLNEKSSFLAKKR